MLLVAHIIEKAQEKAYAEGFRKGFNEVRRERYIQALVNAHQEGREAAYKDADEQILAYHARMRAALDAGEPFDEPPPRFRRNGR